MKKSTPINRPPIFAAVLLSFALASPGMAQSIWDGGGANNNWTTPENWVGDAAPVSGNTTQLQLAGNTQTGINVDSPFTFQRLTVNSGSGAFTLSGSLLTLNGTSPDSGNTIQNSSSQLLTINNALRLTGGSGIYANGNGGVTLKGNIDLNAQTIRFLTGGSGRVITLDGIISGSSSSFAYNGYNGAGSFLVNAANTYTAVTNIWHGTVIANNGGAFSTGGVTLGTNSAGTYNATLLTGTAVTVANNIRLSTNTNATGTNNQTVGGQHTSGTSVFSGNVTLGSDSQAGEDLTITAASGGRVNFSGNLLRASEATGSSDTVTKTGSGIVDLAGSDNNYQGTTLVSAGTLLVNGTLASDGAAVTVNSGATLGGGGSINRDVNLLSGALLEVGDNDAGIAGTLTVGGDLNLATATTVKFDLGANSSLSDQLHVNGRVLLGDTVTFDLTTLAGFGALPVYTLLTTDEGFVGVPANIVFTGSNLDGYQVQFTENSILLVVPEPGTVSLLLAGGLVAVTIARRRRSPRA